MNCMNCGSALKADVRFCPRCGAPVPQPAAYAPPPEQVRTSWEPGAPAAPRRKSRAGKILLIVFTVCLVLAGGVAVAAYFGVRYLADKVKSSEPYQVAERELRENPAASAALGEIKSVGFPLGTFSTEAGGSGQAAFTMSVQGTKASGQYVVALTREGGAWRVANGVLRLTSGEVVTLANEENGAVSVALEGGGGDEDVPAPGPVTVHGAVKAGPLDAKAVSKPEPSYPAAARAAKARGTVVVQVTVDESGQVILAAPVSGHPLLRPAAVAAARQARFSPTLTGGKRSAMTIGTLTYEFK